MAHVRGALHQCLAQKWLQVHTSCGVRMQYVVTNEGLQIVQQLNKLIEGNKKKHLTAYERKIFDEIQKLEEQLHQYCQKTIQFLFDQSTKMASALMIQHHLKLDSHADTLCILVELLHQKIVTVECRHLLWKLNAGSNAFAVIEKERETT